MAETDKLITEIAIEGQENVIAAFQAIGTAGKEAFESIEHALGLTGGVVTAFVAAVGATGFALLEWAKHSSEAAHEMELLAKQSGQTIQNFTALRGALSSMGAETETLSVAYKRLAVQIETQWSSIIKSTKEARDLIINDQLAIKSSTLAVAAAESSLFTAKNNLAQLRGIAVDPQIVQQQQLKDAIRGVEEAELKVAEASQKRAEAAKKADEDQKNSIQSITRAVDAISKGESTMAEAGKTANLDIQNIIKGIVASAGPAAAFFEGQLSGITSSLGDLANAEPTVSAAFFKLADFMHNSGNSALNTALAFRLFGRGVRQDLIQAMSEGSAALKANQEELKKFGLVLTDEDTHAAEAFHKSWNALTNDIKITLTQIGTQLAPAFSDGFKQLSKLIRENHEAIIDFGRTIAENVKPIIADFFRVLTNEKSDKFETNWIAPIRDALKTIIKFISETVLPGFRDLFNIFNGDDQHLETNWAPALVKTLKDVGTVVGEVITVFIKLGTTVDDILTGLGGLINAALGTNITKAEVALTAFGAAVAAAFGPVGVIVAGITAGIVLMNQVIDDHAKKVQTELLQELQQLVKQKAEIEQALLRQAGAPPEEIAEKKQQLTDLLRTLQAATKDGNIEGLRNARDAITEELANMDAKLTPEARKVADNVKLALAKMSNGLAEPIKAELDQLGKQIDKSFQEIMGKRRAPRPGESPVESLLGPNPEAAGQKVDELGKKTEKAFHGAKTEADAAAESAKNIGTQIDTVPPKLETTAQAVKVVRGEFQALNDTIKQSELGKDTKGINPLLPGAPASQSFGQKNIDKQSKSGFDEEGFKDVAQVAADAEKRLAQIAADIQKDVEKIQGALLANPFDISNWTVPAPPDFKSTISQPLIANYDELRKTLAQNPFDLSKWKLTDSGDAKKDLSDTSGALKELDQSAQSAKTGAEGVGLGVKTITIEGDKATSTVKTLSGELKTITDLSPEGTVLGIKNITIEGDKATSVVKTFNVELGKVVETKTETALTGVSTGMKTINVEGGAAAESVKTLNQELQALKDVKIDIGGLGAVKTQVTEIVTEIKAAVTLTPFDTTKWKIETPQGLTDIKTAIKDIRDDIEKPVTETGFDNFFRTLRTSLRDIKQNVNQLFGKSPIDTDGWDEDGFKQYFKNFETEGKRADEEVTRIYEAPPLPPGGWDETGFKQFFQNLLTQAQSTMDQLRQILSQQLPNPNAGGAGGQGLVTGGRVIGSPGIDTNLAWLTHDEFVQPVRSVRAFGLEFMELVRSANFHGVADWVHKNITPKYQFNDGGLVDWSHNLNLPQFNVGGLVDWSNSFKFPTINLQGIGDSIARGLMPLNIPRYASGGQNTPQRWGAAPQQGGVTIDLRIPQGNFRVSATRNVARELIKASVEQKYVATGRMPSWVK